MHNTIYKYHQTKQLISKALMSTCLAMVLLTASQLTVLSTPSGSVMAADNPADNSKAVSTNKNLSTEKDINIAVEAVLKQIEHKVFEISDKLINKKNTTKAEIELKKLQQELDKLNILALKDFENIEDGLIVKKASAEMLQRHRDVVALYEKEVQTLNDNIEAVIKAPNLKLKKKKIGIAKGQFDRINKKTARLPANPKHNPMRAMQPKKNNKPKIRKEEFIQAGLIDTPKIQLATHGSFDISQLPGADNPAFLSATPEVVLSDAIKAKAAELNHDPVKIFNWVHDNTEWLPTWGAIQNSDMVLQSQKGNAFDLASTLIALYRASGIPARYVHGTIDVPVDSFMNWMGGFTSPEGAHDLAANAGLLISSIVSGGKIVGFRMEHIWVEAAIDFAPSRGTINKAADSWIRLDPSFKQYETESGYDMYSLLNFNGDAHFMEYLTDPENLTPYQFYSKKVMGYLNTSKPNWTLAGLYGHERIRQVKTVTNGNLRLLAASLPYKIVLAGNRGYVVPDVLRHKITLVISNDRYNTPDAQFTVSLPELGYDRLTLSYIPDTAADNTVVDDYGSLYSAPAYLVYIKPQFKKAGVAVATGSSVGLGEKQTLAIVFYAPSLTSQPVINQVDVGAYSAIVFQNMEATGDAPSVGMNQLKINAGLNEQGLANIDDTFGQLLHSIGKLWFHDTKYERDFYATTTHVRYTRLPSQVIVSGAISTRYFLGIPKSVTRMNYTMDADTDAVAIGARDANNQRNKAFMLLSGSTGSAWEGLELKGIFGGPDISATKIIKIAAFRGIPIHQITQANIDQKLPLLSLDSDDVIDIQNAVAAGRIATVPQTNITIGSWRGTGLITYDDRGSGVYLVSGGLAGGSACSDASTDPFEKVPLDKVFPPCSEEEWEKKVATRRQVNLQARFMLVYWAGQLLDTPYGWGCKDPSLVPGQNRERCAVNVNTGNIGLIDCSGLVSYAYSRIGYRGFVDKNAKTQYGIVTNKHGWDKVDIGDLIFFDNTFDKNRNKVIDDPLTHVGLVANKSSTNFQWIAAQSKRGVQWYRFGNCPNPHVTTATGGWVLVCYSKDLLPNPPFGNPF